MPEVHFWKKKGKCCDSVIQGCFGVPKASRGVCIEFLSLASGVFRRGVCRAETFITIVYHTIARFSIVADDFNLTY